MCMPGSTDARQIGRTEKINDNLNPDFHTPIAVPYYFEELQEIKFDVFVPGPRVPSCHVHDRYDCDSVASNLAAHDYIGAVQTTVGHIVGAGSGKPLQVRSDMGSGGIVVTEHE